MKKILVTGQSGQLASNIKKLSNQYLDFEFIFVDREKLDLSNNLAIQDYFQNNKFDYCINCAAYTAVDKAETENLINRQINAIAVETIAKELAKQDGFLIHISTDYVFDGENFKPYTETDTTSPVNAYGKAKLEGENLAIANNPKSIVIRTSWVWSEFGKNFVKTMINLGKSKPELNVVTDQVGTPTYAGDLALVILDIINFVEKNKDFSQFGIYNYSNEGVCSWYDFATEIMNLKNINCIVNPIPASQYPTAAKRPYYSVLSKLKIKKNFGIEIAHWRKSLQQNIEII